MAKLRRLDIDDMDAAADVHRVSFHERLPWIPELHTQADTRSFFRNQVFGSCEVWGAERDGRLVGIIAFREGWIDQLYILPEWHRQGIGRDLLELAKAASSNLRLWAFQRNAGARAFYEAHGFVAIQETDGADNDEREPDVLYEWLRPGFAAF